MQRRVSFRQDDDEKPTSWRITPEKKVDQSEISNDADRDFQFKRDSTEFAKHHELALKAAETARSLQQNVRQKNPDPTRASLELKTTDFSRASLDSSNASQHSKDKNSSITRFSTSPRVTEQPKPMSWPIAWITGIIGQQSSV